MKNDDKIRLLFESKKDAIQNAFKNRIKRFSSDLKVVYVYDIFSGDIVEYPNEKIKDELLFNTPAYSAYFKNREDAETYKWCFEIIESLIDAQMEELNFDVFVDVKDIALHNENMYFVSDHDKYLGDNYV